jgi:hypothetical protein
MGKAPRDWSRIARLVDTGSMHTERSDTVLAGYTLVRGDRREVSKRPSSDHAENS